MRPGSTENLLQLQVNGERREVEDKLSLHELITQLNLPSERIAIELNHEVVSRSAWAATILSEDDRVEIVHFIGGGWESTGQ